MDLLGDPVRIMSIIGCGFICVGIMQIMTRRNKNGNHSLLDQKMECALIIDAYQEIEKL